MADECRRCKGAGFVYKQLANGQRTPIACKACAPKDEAKPSKFHNVLVEVDGMTFHSKAEAERWGQLQKGVRAGEIRDLRRQVPYRLRVNGIDICTYRADFVYSEWVRNEGRRGGQWQPVVEDVKSDGTVTEVFKIKQKLMVACFGITIRITGVSDASR